MQVTANITDAEGKSLSVETAQQGADGKPLVTIHHKSGAITVSPAELIEATRRATVGQLYDEMPF